MWFPRVDTAMQVAGLCATRARGSQMEVELSRRRALYMGIPDKDWGLLLSCHRSRLLPYRHGDYRSEYCDTSDSGGCSWSSGSGCRHLEFIRC